MQKERNNEFQGLGDIDNDWQEINDRWKVLDIRKKLLSLSPAIEENLFKVIIDKILCDRLYFHLTKFHYTNLERFS
jgi:hypothetical protein